MGVQIGQILRQAARFDPERVAVIDVGHPGKSAREFRYAELEQMARRVCAQLMAAGVQPGDRVAVVAENSAEVVALWFGIVYAGAAVVPINLLASAAELAQRLGHSSAKLLVHDRARSSLAEQALALGGATRAQLLEDLYWNTGDAVAYPHDTAPSDTALVLYTSGTTGKPKGAAVSHASLLVHTLLLVSHALELSADSRVLCTLPLSHSYGCRLALLAPFYARACVVVVPRFDAERCLQVMREHGVTWLPAVPTMFAAFGQAATREPLPKLRWALCAGAPLGLEIARRAEERLGAPVRQGYGMTEATFATINAPPDQRVPGSVGKPVWGVELRVVDAEGRDVASGESGEVWVRGHNVMTHYLFDADATSEIAANGWVRSGDVGVLDEAGRLRIVDRIKDLIIRGGYNVYPSEVEDALGGCPGVAEVAVVGVPHAFYGEEIVAVIVPEAAPPSSAELHAFVAARLSKTKWPRQYAFVSALPLGASGKVHKRTLRDQLASGEISAEPAPVGPGPQA